MTLYASMDGYDIKYDQFSKEFAIYSKEDGRPVIMGFKTAADAINFAENRVTKG